MNKKSNYQTKMTRMLNPKVARKRVLMISPFTRPNQGGVEAHLDKLINFLKKKNIFVYLITYQPLMTNARGMSVEEGENYIIYRLNWFGRGWFDTIERCFPLTFLYLVPGILFKSTSFYSKNWKEIDAIHAHGFVAAFIAKVLKLIHPVRTVVSTHAVYSLEKRKILASLIRWILSSFDVILAVGEVSKKELIGIGLNKSKVKVHPNWIDIHVFRPYDKLSSRRIFNLPLNKFTVLFVGRLVVKKGIITLIKVAEKVSQDIHFVVVGAGGAELLKVVKASRTLKNFTFIDKLPQRTEEKQKKLAQYYSSADVFVLPSQYPEGFASVILEGIACGTPIIATNMGCVPQIIDKSVGVLINPTEANLKKQTEYFYRHKDELAKKAKNCRLYALENFSEKNAKVIERSYYE